jgi:GTP cyclohydrolase IA
VTSVADRRLGADPAGEGLADTPRRVAAAYAELLTPVPFHGVAHVGYLPGGQVAGWLQERLEPRGAGVVVDAEHCA